MKRASVFESCSTKKLKFEDNLDEIWGSDPDIDDIDDCLLRATQVAEKQLNVATGSGNANCLFAPSSYAAFKKDDIFSSTVANLDVTCKEPQTANGKLEKLQVDLLVKEGENTILRSQLEHTKSALEAEGKKLEEKLIGSRKEMTVIMTELQFKKLEIANLKWKLLDVLKATNQTADTTLKGYHDYANLLDNIETKPMKKLVLEPVIFKICPLKNLISPQIFNVELSNVGRCGLRRVKEKNLQNSESLKQIKLCDDELLKLEFIFPDISTLMNLDEDELNQSNYEKHINKILLVSLQFLHNLCGYLSEFEQSVVTESIRQSDLEYLMNQSDGFDSEVSLFDAKQLFGDEFGIQCRQMVAIVAALVTHNEYTKDFLTGQSSLKLREEETYLSHLTCIKLDENRQFDNKNCLYLQTILPIIQILGRTRKSFNYTGLICSVCVLLSTICSCIPDLSSVVCCSDLIISITEEIIFLRPPMPVLHHLADLLKNAALHKIFVQKLCRMPQKNTLKKNNKKGIVLINKDCCPFQVFSLLYKCSLSQVNEKHCEMNFNTLQFLSNVFSCNSPWLKYQEGKHYDCLFECNELSIEIIYKSLVQFETENYSKVSGKFLHRILRMSVNILSELNLRSYEFIERNIRVCSQYKVIVEKLLGLKDLVHFEKEHVDYLMNFGGLGHQEEGAHINPHNLDKHFL